VKYALLLLLTSVCSVACKKEPGPGTDPEDHLIPAGMKAYWDFKEGSWWAYQDSVSGIIDTVEVVEYTNNTFYGILTHSGRSALCERLEILTYNTNDQYYNRYSINTARSSVEGPEYNVVFRSKFGGPSGGSEGGTKCFVYPKIVGLATYLSNGVFTDTIVLKNVYDSLWAYSDVVQINQNYSMVDDYQHTRTYWAANVGIIKQVFVESAVIKTLVDYHIDP
jgi:hypothetical protein